MSFQRQSVAFVVLCACDSLADPTLPEPLPADLVAACPESARFERSVSGSCTEIGCVSGFDLNVSPSSGWLPGAYRFELSVDARAVTCEGSFPLKVCAEPSFSCDADGVRLNVSGCALPADQQGIGGISFAGFPRAISLRVLKDSDELASAELTPAYSASQPNGPGCEPICCSASGQLLIPLR